MDADLPTLHVARFASEVDPSLAGGNEGLARLELLRAVLRRIARDPVVHHPGLVSECAMDSVGALLTKRGSVDAEAHRRALMVGEPPADVRVWLARPLYRSVPIEEARQLSPQALQDAIPLRNADAVAVPLRADERRREEVRVAFGASGAQLVLRRRGRVGVELVATAGTGHGSGRATLVSDPLPHRSGGEVEADAGQAPPPPPPPSAPPIDCEEDEGLAIEAENPDNEYDNLDALLATYEDGDEPDPASAAGAAAGSERDAEDVVVAELDRLFAVRAGAMLDLPIPPARTPKLLERAQVPTYVLPDWLTEVVATAFQEIGRVTAVLAAAAPPGASVALAVERATLTQHHDRKVETDVRTVTRLQLHALAGTCICGAYPAQARRNHCGEPKHVLLEMQSCGMPFAQGATRCAAHFARNAPPSEWDQTCCPCDPRLRMVCQHERGRPVSLRIDVPPDLDAMVTGLAALAAATCAERPKPSNARALELCRAARAWEQKLYAQLCRQRPSLQELDHGDRVAEGLLRSLIVRRGKPRRHAGSGRMLCPLVRSTGGALRQEETALSATHGHLFLPLK